MKLHKVRQKYLEFFKTKGHVIIPSASLLPEDKTVLFITAGMQPLVPHLMGKPHKKGQRLTNAQKCLRTDDILEVGDNRHLTFFEMLGNWSLGDYFKEESIAWSFELLTSKEWFNISPDRLYVTVFEGYEKIGISRDDESIAHWIKAFATKDMEVSLGNHIFAYPKSKNWWELSGPGPCGPDTEIFYDTKKEHDISFGETCHVNCDCGRYVEIWNNVFMEYEKKQNGEGSFLYVPLAQKNVDTGMGLERMAMVLQGKDNVFEIDIFDTIIKILEKISDKKYQDDKKSFHVIADHMRAFAFLIVDGVLPSNTDQGYTLRRLVRRAMRYAQKIGLRNASQYASVVFCKLEELYSNIYPEIKKKEKEILDYYIIEENKFRITLKRLHKVAIPRLKIYFEKDPHPPFEKYYKDLGRELFSLVTSEGGSLDELLEIVDKIRDDFGFSYFTGERKNKLKKVYDDEFKKHQEISRAGAEKKFGGHGLLLQTGELKASDKEELAKVTRLHSATHLLQAALRKVLGEHVHQMGSDITVDRLRFDFSHSAKLTDEEKKRIEDMVNQQIQNALPVTMQEMPVDEAEKTGAMMFQKDKYGDTVKVYSIGTFSKELCGGPHVKNTKDIGKFIILKEKASSAGVRRIRAVVE